MQYAPENVENHVCAHTKQTQTGLAHAQSALLYDGEKGQAGAPWKLVTASLPRQRLENGVHNSLFFFFQPPHSLWSSWARVQNRATVVTYTTAAGMPDP